MIRVQVRPNEPLEAALRRFKRQCNYAGIFRLAKKYAFFEKRSDRRRREDRERIRNIQRAMRRQDTGPVKGRRRSKVRSSSVTPESARAAAEDQEELTTMTARERITPSAAPKTQTPQEAKVTSAQENES